MKDGIIRQSSTRHMSANIEGMLRFPKRLHNVIEDDGRPLTSREAVVMLKKLQVEGAKVIPCGDCPTFSDQTGCPGHPTWSLVEDWYFEMGNG